MQKKTGTDQYEIPANRIENAVKNRRTARDLKRSVTVFRSLSEQDIVEIYIAQDGTFSYVNG